MISNYNDLKTKFKEYARESSYIDSMVEILASMFTYDNLPTTLDADMLELFLIMGGMVAVYNDDEMGGLIASTVNLGGRPDVYGRGTEPITATLNGKTKTWTDRSGLVVGFNNDRRLPDLMLDRIANMLAKVDASLVLNVLYSRLLPIPTASNDTQKKQLESALKKILDGEMSVIMSDNILKEIETGSNGIDIVNISDVSASDKIQYLAHFHDDLTRWFYNLYGMCTQGSGKMAQQSTDEINGGLSASFILPLDKLRHRQKMVDEINATFGTNITVRFSDAWVTQWNRTALDDNPNDNGEDLLEGTADDVEKEDDEDGANIQTNDYVPAYN